MQTWVPSLPLAGCMGGRLARARRQVLAVCQRLRPAPRLSRRQDPRTYARDACQEAEAVICAAKRVMAARQLRR